MKANEYIKKYGIDCANDILKHNEDLMNLVFFKDLKRLVESHEYIENFGGIDKAKRLRGLACFLTVSDCKKHNQAIADVESCQMEVDK